MAWRENNRRISNGEQYLAVINAALLSAPSAEWKGYWQRRAAQPLRRGLVAQVLFELRGTEGRLKHTGMD